METFAKRLSNVRKQSGMTQSEVAEKLNVSFQAVSLWESGETSPEISKLPEIAELFHVTTDWLLTGKKSIETFFDAKTELSERLFNEEEMYTYVKTYATVKGMNQTLKVLPYAREQHEGQFRSGKTKVPYIYHPLVMSCHALSLGLVDDNLISATLLHDVCEDCGVLAEELPVNEETRQAVILLTKKDSPESKTPEGQEKYYEGIATNKIAIMVKLLDRCNNVSGMAMAFSRKKMARYIRETEKWVFPLFERTKVLCPEYSDQVFLIKYHMASLVQSLKKQLS